jgi:hypothetical protein
VPAPAHPRGGADTSAIRATGRGVCVRVSRCGWVSGSECDACVWSVWVYGSVCVSLCVCGYVQ